MIELLAEGKSLIAVNKPAGMLVIPGRVEDRGASLREVLTAQLKREVWVVHRLDRETSGVMIFALDAASHRAASMAFEAGQAKKRYLALVVGRVEKELDLKYPLIEARKRRMKVAPPGMGKESRTLVRPKQLFEKVTLVECEPLTGRQHQIRVHLTACGHPLLVDHQYAGREPLTFGSVTLGRTPLHAASLEIASLQFAASAPLPADMQQVIEQLSAIR